MKTRSHQLFASSLTVLLLCLLPVAALGKGNRYKDIVKHLETNYHAKRTKIPLLGLANFAVKVIRPAGVKGFKLTVFEDQDFSPRAGEGSFLNVMRSAYTAQQGWRPLVQTNSKRDGQQRAFIFIKENKKDVEVAVTTLSDHDAAVIEVKFSPDKLVQFLDNPRIMGISLGQSLRGPNNNTVAGGMNGAVQPVRSSAPPKPSEPTGNSIVVVDRTREVAVAADPKANQPGSLNLSGNLADSQRIALQAMADVPANLKTNALTDTPAKAGAAEAASSVSSTEPKDPNAIRIETRLVNLNVRAVNKAGLPLTDLKPEDFHVFEDDAKQEVAHFKPVNTPVNLLILLDMSGSTQRKHKTMIESVRKFIDLLPANDKMSIVAFTRKYHRLTPFTNDKALLKTAVERIKNISGGTAYYDAMVEAMTDLNKLGDARKAVVVLTDGEDESIVGLEPTGFSFEQMLDRAAESDVTIYPIYFNGSDQYQKLGFAFGGNPYWNKSNDRRSVARKQLQAVADQTGGELVNAQNEGDLAAAYARVATELHTLYSLAYSPDKLKHDGSFRQISVKVARADAVAKTRKGYYDK